MAIFNFGNKQRLHTQLVGNTTGREMFRVDEYNQRKKTSIGLGFIIFGLLTLFYFFGKYISGKWLTFLIIGTLGLGIWFYFNYKQQRILRRGLY